ncbi:MAG: hypothetical protein AVDCRST_MAG77-5222 [uncultured Chloroflexi bacterium]|uniref:Blue (type 1) copper domain-containing protein n=1 Tax=uncultured Chloroflexota bacterium TaxID=166587 RepID=A0A6J4K070_9CHLR|nr:MAG: hypothetical protein AVDCRST_MAG77-5222 [uncultured Chloroflexota bacterium]
MQCSTTPRLIQAGRIGRATRAAGAAALLSLALVAGCGQGSEAAPADALVFVVDGTDTMRFLPDPITVKAGQAVTIVFRNKGVIVHDYISSGSEKNARLANVLGGREARGVFQASKPGTYQVLCQQPGHREAGMVGTIVVE